MKFIVDKEELNNVFGWGIDGEDFEYDKFMETLKPVELLAEGEVIKEDEEGMYIDGDLLDWKIGKLYRNGKVKIYVEAENDL